jgi:hypothetical protein
MHQVGTELGLFILFLPCMDTILAQCAIICNIYLAVIWQGSHSGSSNDLGPFRSPGIYVFQSLGEMMAELCHAGHAGDPL